MKPLALWLLTSGMLSCTAIPEAETPEELLFTVPSWCTWDSTPQEVKSSTARVSTRLQPSRPRSDWAQWAQARQTSDEGPGLCGVRISLPEPKVQESDQVSPPFDEAGICVKIQKNQPQKIILRSDRGVLISSDLEPPPNGSFWYSVKLRDSTPSTLYIRVYERSIEAYLEGSSKQEKGPCFYGK